MGWLLILVVVMVWAKAGAFLGIVTLLGLALAAHFVNLYRRRYL